jgi:hypothetical protein
MLLGTGAAMLGAPAAQAGVWMRTACVNPDDSPASSDGWSSFATGTTSVGSTPKVSCGPNDPMMAILSMRSNALAGSADVLQYTPPDGSTLVGGSALVGLSADGYGPGSFGIAAMYTPAYVYDASNMFARCEAQHTPCQNGGSNYYGIVQLPPDRGGNLYIAAGCRSDISAGYCSQGGSHGAWALAVVGWARLLLSTGSLPTATDFRGGLLEPAAHGTASLAFTAADDGPGVHTVTVSIDGKAIYDATPNTNSGKCVPAGADPATGAPIWAWQQPCPRSQTVDLTVKTTTLADGPHELKIVVKNAARNASTVLRRTITTNNRTTVSSGLTSDKVPTKLAPAAVYSVVLDPPTQALIRGVRRAWSRSALTMSGTLRNSAGVPAPGVLVTLFAKSGEGAPEAVARTSTDAAGHWVLAAPQGASRMLTISYGEQPDPASPLAISVRQVVKPNVSLRVRPLGRGRLRFSGRLRIDPLGSPRPLIVIQTRNRARKWKGLGPSLRVSRTGRYSVIYNGGPSVIGGSYAFRTVVHATSLFAAGVSPIRRVRVR